MAQQTLAEGERVIGEAMKDGAVVLQLIETEDGADVADIWPDAPTEEEKVYRTHYDNEKDALLHFRLWVAADGWHTPESGTAVPMDVAVLGKPALAAWMRTNGCRGRSVPRETIARRLGVSEHTVSGYLTKVRNGELGGGKQHESREDLVAEN